MAGSSGTLRLVLGDQLTVALASLQNADPKNDVILLAEVRAEATYVRHHKKKIAFLFSAMRHFADELRTRGFTVRYTSITDPANTHSLKEEVARALTDEPGLTQIALTECGEWRLADEQRGWAEAVGVPVAILTDDRFVASHADFARWAGEKKQLRMEFFYRDMRRRTGLLMDGDEPVEGRWNFDAENRNKMPKGLEPPKRLWVEPDAITRSAMADVESQFPDHFGTLEPFGFATTRADAQRIADIFIAEILPGFGEYQDAMANGEPWLWHSIVSMYLNCGLLDPLALCRAAEGAWKAGKAPINAVEGFIRQIIGWREYIRGIYWHLMPEYATRNHLNAKGQLPDFYWTAQTDMACVKDAVTQTRDHAYSHHIQRLMITGNFALLAGIDPDQVDEWYLAVYADAYEWVELPNTRGMALYADGGVVGSKPYAASGAYIDRMSDHCARCSYAVKLKAGPKACPFNYLYWDFMARNEKTLNGNPRLSNPLATLRKMTPERRAEIARDASVFLKSIAVQK